MKSTTEAELLAEIERLKKRTRELETRTARALRAAEQQLMASEDKQHESESRYRALFENMAAASCMDEIVYENGRAVDYRIIDVNPAYERITGIRRQDAAGSLASELYGPRETKKLRRLTLPGSTKTRQSHVLTGQTRKMSSANSFWTFSLPIAGHPFLRHIFMWRIREKPGF